MVDAPLPMAHALTHFLSPPSTESTQSHPLVEGKTQHEIVFVSPSRIIVKVSQGAILKFEEEIEKLYRSDPRHESDEPPFYTYSFGHHVAISFHDKKLAKRVYDQLKETTDFFQKKLPGSRYFFDKDPFSTFRPKKDIKRFILHTLRINKAALEHLESRRRQIEEGIQSKEAQLFASLMARHPELKEKTEFTKLSSLSIALASLALLAYNPIFAFSSSIGATGMQLVNTSRWLLFESRLKNLVGKGVHAEWAVHQLVPENPANPEDLHATIMERRGIINELAAKLRDETKLYERRLETINQVLAKKRKPYDATERIPIDFY